MYSASPTFMRPNPNLKHTLKNLNLTHLDATGPEFWERRAESFMNPHVRFQYRVPEAIKINLNLGEARLWHGALCLRRLLWWWGGGVVGREPSILVPRTCGHLAGFGTSAGPSRSSTS